MEQTEINQVYFHWYNAVLLHKMGAPIFDMTEIMIASYGKDALKETKLVELNDSFKERDEHWAVKLIEMMKELSDDEPEFLTLFDGISLTMNTGLPWDKACLLYVLKQKLKTGEPTENDIMFARRNFMPPFDRPVMQDARKWNDNETWQKIFTETDFESDSVEFTYFKDLDAMSTETIIPGNQLESLMKIMLETGLPCEDVFIKTHFNLHRYKTALPF